jgi:hypothetical protein
MDLGGPRVASRSLRRNNRAFGPLPCQTATPHNSPAPMKFKILAGFVLIKLDAPEAMTMYP